MDSQGEKRPWLAALLGTLATGLGHIYLRRWKRGLGWFAAAVLASVFFVPPEAAQSLISGDGDPAALAPVLAVGIASVADAYVLARSQQRRSRAASPRRTRTNDADRSGADAGVDRNSSPPAGGLSTDAVDDATCPHCGKDLDPDLDFCPWCTTRLDDERGGA